MKNLRSHALKFFISSLGLLCCFTANAQDVQLSNARDYQAMDDAVIGQLEGGFGVAPGTDVSGLSIMDAHGEEFALNSLWAEKPALIIFYRGGWCPFCNAQVRELSQEYSQFEAAGVTLGLISVDKPDASAMLKSTYEIPFAVLSDQDLVAHEAFNVVLDLSPEAIARAAERGRDYSDWSDRDHEKIAVASSFVVGTDGKVLSGTVIEDYRQRPSIEQLLSQIAASK